MYRDSDALSSRPSARRALLPGGLLLLAAALVSGLALDQAPRLLTLLHLLGGSGAAGALVVFLHGHWWRRRRRVGAHPNARYGYVALVALLLLFVSGLLLLRWTNWALPGRVHGVAAALLTADLLFHAAWRLRQRVPTRAGARIVIPVAGVGLLLLGVGFQLSPTPVAPPANVISIAHDTLGDRALPAAADCAACHSDVAAAWGESIHAAAATDPYYRALATLFVQERGVDAARYCAACHSPVGLMAGEIDAAAGRPGNDAAHAYEARALRVDVALSPAAAEGVSCVVCHRAAPAAGGAAGVAAGLPLPTDLGGRLTLRVAPDQHRADLSPAVLEESALCAACHNLATPEGLLLEPTYDEWLASPYAEQGVSCQDCHMPDVPGTRVDSVVGGQVAAHGGLPGAPSSLPGVSADPTLLRQAATLDAAWTSTGQLMVTVTNSGAGHYLPTGADDLRQVWLEVVVRDAAGAVVWQQGVLDAADRLPPDAVRFGKVLGDAQNRPVTLHRFWVATQVLEDTRLAPGESRPLAFTVSGAAGRSLTATVRLLYRDVPPGFAEFALGEPLTSWPPLEMAVAMAALP